MTTIGCSLRAGGIALRWRWVRQLEAERDEARRQRDDARAARDVAENVRDAATTEWRRTRRRLEALRAEVNETRNVLAPDVDAGAALVDVARASLASAQACAVAAELRWWAARDGFYVDEFRARAQHLDPSGITPVGDEPPTPSIFRKPTDDEVAEEVRAAGGAPRGRPSTTLTFGNELGDRQAPAAPPAEAACGDSQLSVDGSRDAHRDATRMPGVPRAAYDVDGDVFPPPGRPVPDAVVDGPVMCGFLADGVECGGADGHRGGCWPDPQALARRALEHAAPLGYPAAARVLADAHLLTDRGMTVDGDLLTEVVTEAAPPWMRDDDARVLAERALDGAVSAGMTVLHGPSLLPRAAVAS